MPATGRRASRPRATEATRARYEEGGRAIDRLAKSLEAAQKDLSGLRGSIGTGAEDLRKDLSRLLRDARRDVGKMSKAVRRDLERVQKDLASAAGSTRVRRGTSAATKTSRSRSRGSTKTRG